MKELSIGADLKCAAARGNERERLDAFAEFENFGRQTDGLRRVVSNDAIFDRDFRLHSVRSFPVKMVRKSGEAVKGRTVGPLLDRGGGISLADKTKKRPRIGPRPPF